MPADGPIRTTACRSGILATLATRLITEFPEYYGYFAEKEFAFDNRAPQNRFNRNPLLGLGIGADGLKTGHTQEAGYGLVGSASQGERRIVFVITGLDSQKARAEEAERLVSWAFRQFVQKTVIKKGHRVATADVWLGDRREVDLVPAQDVNLLVPALEQDGIEAEARFASPIEAPVDAGEEIGRLVISMAGLPDSEVPLVASETVAKGGFLPRMRLAAGTLVAMAMERAQGGPDRQPAE